MNLLILLAGLLLQAAPRTASIEGFVVRAGTNPVVPLANARLELTGPGEFVARTDSFGKFVFSELPPGRFLLRVAKDGYIRQAYPRAVMDERGLPINVAAGQEIRNVVFRLDPAPTIAGIVRDEGTAPVAGIEVRALKRVYGPFGERSLSLLASTLTDDHGRYRLYWLDPGEYFVLAMTPVAPEISLLTQFATGNKLPIAPSYFPGYVDPDGASPIRVESGRDAVGMDINLVRQPLATVRIVMRSVTTGGPANTRAHLVSPEDGNGVARYQNSPLPPNPGTVTLVEVAPGSYIASATLGTETAAVRVRIRNTDARVDLLLNPGVPIQGRMFNGAGSPMDLKNVRMRLAAADPALPEPAPVSVAADGQFVVPAVQPGDYAVGIDGLPADLYMKSATVGQTDVLASPLSLLPGAAPPELTMEIGMDGGRVSGAVFDSNDRPFTGAQVVLAPAPESRQRVDRYRTTMTAEDGSFSIRGIPPGEYRGFALMGAGPNAYLNAEFMRPFENLAVSLQVQPDSTSTVSLRLIQAAP